MTHSGPMPGPARGPRRRRSAGPDLRRLALCAWAVSAILAGLAPWRSSEGADRVTTQPTSLEHIYACGVPTSVDDLRQMDEHQRALVQHLLRVTVGLEIGPTQGSGVIVSRDGYVLTAAHVAGESGRDVWVITSDGRRWRGRTLGLHKGMDAGLIQITDAPSAAAGQSAAAAAAWPYAEMGDAWALQPGSWCLGLGHPGGYQRNRQAAARLGRVLSVTSREIETDCVLVGGDSGGPLFDMDGRVVGIHSRIGNELTKNLHVPVQAFRDQWERLARGESWGSLLELVGRPMIGVLGARDSNEPRVVQVLPASPAEAAGVQPGDLIIRFGDRDVKTFDDLKQLVGRCNPGDEVTIEVARGAETKALPLLIGAQRASADTLQPGESPRRESRLRVAARADEDPSQHARNHATVLEAFRDVVGGPTKCTVRVLCHGQQVALGTIFDADGYIATKGSELDGPTECELADGTRYAAELLGVDRGSDLAVLKIPVQGLPAIGWRDGDPPEVGGWLVTPGPGTLPEAVGIASVAPHAVRGAVLGVQLTEDRLGPRVVAVVPGSGAADAGLLCGDVITRLNDETVETADALVAATSALLPGEAVTVTIQRAGKTHQVRAVLGSVSSTLASQRARYQDQMGSPLSQRRVLFPSALEHDCALLPNQCGGPLVDLDGRAIGINIARASRVATYAIPARVARPLLEAFTARPLVTVSTPASPER